MKTSEIRSMNDDQLKGAELNTRQALFEARLARATGELSDTTKVRKHRRDLAKILTVTKERAASKES
tara:strand:+ start:291 stop:491 length:201 start_codon:yes stop_codon:yes gene_type:complete